MIKSKKNDLKNSLGKVFSKNDKAKFYFVKGLKDYNETIVVKTKNVIDSKKLKSIKDVLQKDLQAPYLELLQWMDTVGGLIPKKNIYKIPFFDTDEIKIYNPWRVCPVGEYWVRRHLRQKTSLEDVDGHCRKNKSKKDQLNGDEINLISKHKLFKNPQLKATPNELVFKGIGNQFDDLINGWVAYWNDVFKIVPPLHPNFVKALVATESGFDPKSFNNTNKKSTGPARGLLQITEKSQRQLSGNEKELKDHFVILDNEEIWDPNKNICAGVRWLFRKREIARNRLKREPSWEEVLMEYKGRTTSTTAETKRVKNDLYQFLRQLGAR